MYDGKRTRSVLERVQNEERNKTNNDSEHQYKYKYLLSSDKNEEVTFR